MSVVSCFSPFGIFGQLVLGVTEWAGHLGAPATIFTFSAERFPPQDLHFIVSRETLPGRSIFRVTFWVSPAFASFRRVVIQMIPIAAPIMTIPTDNPPNVIFCTGTQNEKDTKEYENRRNDDTDNFSHCASTNIE